MPMIDARTMSGKLLDYAVALFDPKCEGLKFEVIDGVLCGVDPEDEAVCIFLENHFAKRISLRVKKGFEYAEVYAPTDISTQSFFILNDHITEFLRLTDKGWHMYQASVGYEDDADNFGETQSHLALEAICRAFVIAKAKKYDGQGPLIDVPQEIYESCK